MRLLVLLSFIYLICATCTTENILSCYNGFIDLNGDNGMNLTELDHFLMYHPCNTLFTKQWGMELLDNCDVNRDGVFNVTDTLDWTNCLEVIALKNRLCEDCDVCNTIFVIY